MEVSVMMEAENRAEEIVVDMEENVSDRSNQSSTINYNSLKCHTGHFSLLERQQILDILKEELKSQLDALGLSGTMNQSSFCKLFSNESVLNLVFHLFDVQSDGKISPSHVIELFKDALGTSGREFVDLLDTLIYVVANESNLDFELFKRIFTLNAVQYKLYALIDTKHTDSVTVDDIIALWADVTMSRKIKRNEEQLKNADTIFESYKKEGTEELTLEDFKKLIPCKNPFFAERAFRLFDRDQSNSISIKEYRETLQQFSNQSVDDKVRFLFQIYDQDGDGVIKLEELKSVLTACSEENGMKFSDEQMDQLTLALYEDAKQREDDELDDGIGFEELKAQMAKQPGLLENLSTSLERFLVPVIPSKNKKDQRSSSSVFSKKYLRNNISIVFFVTGYVAINLILFLTRMVEVYMDTKNVFYMLARASGQALNFNCAFVVVLMLRHSITWLRMRGLASILPLDHHVYLHKVCGIMIVFFSFLHTVMHLINFPLKVADYDVSKTTNRTHTAIEWLFTADPGTFGLVPGWACLTGWVLVVLLGIMAAFSLPIVRKSGCFEIFYWSHLLFVPFWINLILHGPNFWYWFIGPGFLFIFVEKLAQFINRWFRQGRSFISSAVLLPSRVTHLVIKKPPNFHYHPGDYVYIQIPSLTRYEWHPFTISSAPELPDYLWLHVRCAGGWTNKLYEFFELKMAESCCYHQGSTVVCQPSCKSCYNKLLQNKHPSTFAMNIRRSQNKSEICTLTHDRSSTRQSVKRIGSFKKQQSCAADPVNQRNLDSQVSMCSIRRNSNIYRNPLLPSRIISMPTPEIEDPEPTIPENPLKIRKRNISTPRATYAPETLATANPMSSNNNEILSVSDLLQVDSSSTTSISRRNSHPRTENLLLEQAVEVRIDGPYGAPSSHIFRAQHAVLIAAGIGVTPFASILQSIMNRYHAVRQSCPSCKHNWVAQMPDSIMNLKKVDFFWINRDQQSFEWFISLLSQLEMEQAEMGGALERFLDLHMYMTSALNKNDMKAVGLQMALDLLHAKEKRDLVTGLKTRSNAGRPNWDKVFQKILDEKKGKVTVFYCGPPQLARELKGKCDTFGFSFRKEIF